MKRDKISSSVSRSYEDGRSKKTESVPFRCHLLVPVSFYSYTWSRDSAAPGANFHVLLLENLDEAVESGFLDLRRDGASMSDHHADADDVDGEQLLAGAITERSARNPGCWRQCSVRPEDASRSEKVPGPICLGGTAAKTCQSGHKFIGPGTLFTGTLFTFFIAACSGKGSKRMIMLVATGGLEPPTSAL